MGVRQLLGVGALALVLVAAGSAAIRPRPEWISWADRQHGWAANHETAPFACRDVRRGLEPLDLAGRRRFRRQHLPRALVEAGMAVEPVIAGEVQLSRVAAVPDGILAVYLPGSGLEVIVRTGGENVSRRLDLPSTIPGGVVGQPAGVAVDWPEIRIEASYQLGSPIEVRPSWEVVWTSRNGGKSWSASSRTGWSSEPQDPIARAGAATGTAGGEAVLAGGASFGFEPADTARVSRLAQAYSPQTRTWRRLPRLPAARAYAAGASSANRFYVLGGFDSRGRATRSAYAFGEGRWRRMPALPEPRAAAGATVLAGKVYLVGGLDGHGLARRMLVLDLAQSRWRTAAGPTPRAYLGVAAAGGRVFALGGRTGGLSTSSRLAESFRAGTRVAANRSPPVRAQRDRCRRLRRRRRLARWRRGRVLRARSDGGRLRHRQPGLAAAARPPHAAVQPRRDCRRTASLRARGRGRRRAGRPRHAERVARASQEAH
jgi:Kelch motif protein